MNFIYMDVTVEEKEQLNRPRIRNNRIKKQEENNNNGELRMKH